MAVISMKQLLEAGVHFGHQTRRWNPKWKNISSLREMVFISSTYKKTVKKSRLRHTTSWNKFQKMVDKSYS